MLVWSTREREGGSRWEHIGGQKWTWEICGICHLIGCWRLCISVLTNKIGRHTCPIWLGKSTCIQNSVQLQLLPMISPISIALSRHYHQLCIHLRTHTNVVSINFSMPQSEVNTVYSYHQVLHHSKIHCLPHQASSSSLHLLSLNWFCCSRHSTF